MPLWQPEPIWEGLDVFIIGGGTSLRDFDWPLLIDEKTIGCNQAFRLGHRICDICMFGDHKFLFERRGVPRMINFEPMSKFQGWVVTNDPKCIQENVPWLKCMKRHPVGLYTDALGWNSNTGAAAINLALILGANTVYLLGFDMFLDTDGKPNWHTQPLIDKPKESLYQRMISNMGKIQTALPRVFPGRTIVNVSDRSKLNMFPMVPCDVFWHERKNGNGRVWTGQTEVANQRA
jgi:hypothetical protein